MSAAVTLLNGIRTTPVSDPGAVAPRLAELAERLRDVAEGAALVAALKEGPFRDLMGGLAEHSRFLWQLALADPARLARIAGSAPDELHQAIVSRQGGMHAPFAAGTLTLDDVARELRRNRAEHALTVALADIAGLWSVEQVTLALSQFADASVQSAVAVTLAELAQRGKLALPDPANPSEGCGLTVLALGKHGAGELNYSSDIDLILFYDPQHAPLADRSEAATLYSRVAKNVAKLLSERTADGYVHRVDYRLRPDPGSTPVAVSLPAAYTYYETLGQNWERAAFIKARAIAGEVKLGETFIADLAPFIWRKYFDFAAIADIHAMKRQIHLVRGHDEIAVAGHDIKLGRGGIREIEFFVQTQQLVFGGRRPALRGRSTLAMLRELHDENWISAKARDELTEAYRFLRSVEHRLQMVADEQTQRLPQDEEALDSFAHFLGYADSEAFGEALCIQARKVQGHYSLLFEEGPELANDLGNLVFTGAGDDPETLATLRRLGFRNPEAAAEMVRGWHFGRRAAVTSPRAREVLTELVPSLLVALGGTADPDGALSRLDSAFGRMPAAIELMTILRSHERLRLLFADLLGTAPRLADTVAQSPHVLDGVIDPAFVSPVTDEAQLASQVRQMTASASDYEEFLDRSRDAARQLRFLTGARMLSGILTPADAGRAYAGIAEGIVQVSLEQVERAFAIDHGVVPGARIAIVALGRLGARDLTESSDLDLVVLYDFDAEARMSDGARPLDATVYYNRLTQRLVGALTAPTRRGRLYDVDLRLRPSGGKGPVASQFRGFLAYQQEEAELWEHMALTRARVIAGDPAFGEEVSTLISEVIRLPRDPTQVRRETAAMRGLIAQEKGEDDPWDLKLASGGLTDLDFIAQTLVLAHAGTYSSLAGLATAPAIAEAGRLGLIEAGDAEALVEAHRLINDVLHWQRLTVEGALDPEQAPSILARLATAMACPDAATLRNLLDDTRTRVRAIFRMVVG